MTGKRVFKMAPLHHHFELIGWSEPKVITRFVIVGDHFCVVQSDDVEAAVMAMAFSVDGKSVTVAGAARSGIAAAELLTRRGARVTLSDTRAAVPEAERLTPLGVKLELGGHQAGTFATADLVVLSPGVPPDQPVIEAARRLGVPVIGEVELASRWLQGRVIAITGTKGKSTTTELTGRMLEAAGFKVTVGGNIGAPLSAQVADSTPETLHVVETSSFQLEQIDTFHPWIAVMLNFSPDHLDRHPTVEAYAAAKSRIFENQQPATGRSSTPTIRRCSKWRDAGAHRSGCSREAHRLARQPWRSRLDR